MEKVNSYLAPFQKPSSGLTTTRKLVRSCGLGKLASAILPASNEATSVVYQQ